MPRYIQILRLLRLDLDRLGYNLAQQVKSAAAAAKSTLNIEYLRRWCPDSGCSGVVVPCRGRDTLISRGA